MSLKTEALDIEMSCQFVMFQTAPIASDGANPAGTPHAAHDVRDTSTTAAMVNSAAGARRAMRRRAKPEKPTEPVASCSRRSWPPMRKPDSVKNTETPRNPPPKIGLALPTASAW